MIRVFSVVTYQCDDIGMKYDIDFTFQVKCRRVWYIYSVIVSSERWVIILLFCDNGTYIYSSNVIAVQMIIADRLDMLLHLREIVIVAV